jgi:ketosteroid isomerase-like protein
MPVVPSPWGHVVLLAHVGVVDAEEHEMNLERMTLPNGSAEGMDRRSLLQFGVAGLGLAAAGRMTGGGSGAHLSGPQRRTQLVAARLLRTIPTGDTAAMWAQFATGGFIEFPLLGTRISDFATFEAAVGPLFAQLPDLAFSEPAFEPMDDPSVVIAKFTGHATVTFTGKAYNQTYLSQIRVHRDKVVSYAEYFDTAVLNEAFTP